MPTWPDDSDALEAARRWLWWLLKILLLLGFVLGLILGVTMLMLILISLVTPVEGEGSLW